MHKIFLVYEKDSMLDPKLNVSHCDLYSMV